METTPSYEEGQLVVAAVRLLHHREKRPPTIEAIAELIGEPAEMCGHLARGLASLGIVKILKNPFDTRLEIVDHLRLETLPRGAHAPAIESEIQEFKRKFEKEREDMQRQLLGKDHERRSRDRMAEMERKLSQFRPRGMSPGVPSGGDPEEEEE